MEDSHDCCHSKGNEGDERPPQRMGKGTQYTCPMHPEVVSDEPGDCPKCGMTLEPMSPTPPAGQTLYTCPMHPEIEQEGPGDCPICGMPLEPKTVAGGHDEHAEAEIRDLSRKFWIGTALTIPVLLIAMAKMSCREIHAAIIPPSRW